MGQVFVAGRFATVRIMVHKASFRNRAELDIEKGIVGDFGQFENKAGTHF